MHRSGTSLTASWLQACGLPIHDGNLVGPATGNPKGHFEDDDFMSLHSAAILQQYPKSRGWKVVTYKFIFFEDEQLRHATSLVSQRNAKYELWSWKDPRSVIYLRHWKRIIPTLKVLLIWRPCCEVVHSLLRRSRKAGNPVFKINVFESVKLWISYNKRLCEYKQEYPDDTLLFPLEYVVSYDKNVLNLLNKKFQVDLKYRPINEIYERRLLNRQGTSVWARLASLCYGSSNVEKAMNTLSDNA